VPHSDGTCIWRNQGGHRAPRDLFGAPGADNRRASSAHPSNMIRKLKSGEYRLYSRKKNPSTGKRRNLGTFSSKEKAEEHERAVQYFKRH
jgi:hypothetical protein